MPSDIEPSVAANQPEATGSLVIMFREGCEASTASQHIEDVIGWAPARSRDYVNQMSALTLALHDHGAALFDDFGLAIVDPVLCNIAPAIIEGMSGLEDVALVRPEYRMEAIGWWQWLFPSSAAKTNPQGVSSGKVQVTETPTGANENNPNSVTWGLSAIGADASPYSGEGVKIAVLDTGFDFDHSDFAGRTIVSESFVSGESAQDVQGHGTHVAGTAVGPRAPTGVARYGVAPDAVLFVGKVLDNSGSGREGDILAGILWALQNNCQVVSMSLGRRALPGDSAGDYDRVGQIALDQGSLIIAAAGNESTRRQGVISPVGAPANARSILAVGAVDEAFALADFTNGGLNPDGGAIDITAPGVNVLSSTPGQVRHRALSGTSMATPHVAGIAALLAQSDEKLRGKALWEALTRSARQLDLPARDIGAGLVQAPTPPSPPSV